MKKCFKCNIEKDLSEFYKHSKMSDGHLGKCKNCTKYDTVSNKNKNLEYYQEYDRNRPNKLERCEKKRLHQKTEHALKLKHAHQKKYKAKNKNKTNARSHLRRAVISGKLIKKNCSICGNEKSEAHHEDYSKPLDVIWYCDFHHKARHKEINAEKRKAKKCLQNLQSGAIL